MSTASRLVCLLPVRNGAHDLPGFLASVDGIVDAIVALDDGSTDATRELLDRSPLVKVLVTNPPRRGYAEWDDSANRNRLLEAAAELDPAWILSLDADERLDPADGRALRRFVDEEALAGCVFGFLVFRLWGEEGLYDPSGYWVYRLFAYEPGQRFPEQRLHFDPVPTSIPRARWVRTTLRIQHLAGLTPDRRRARIEKYREADPDQSYGYAYPDAVEAATEVAAWPPRDPGQPVIAADPAIEVEAPVALSAIVISKDDEERIARTVASVVSQESEWPFEVIVVTSGADRTAEIVRTQFPQVTLIELPRPALPGEARNAGIRVARGDYVSFPGSHVELPPGSLAARIEAHDGGYAMVTGTTANGTDTRSGWAAYFLDHASVLPGRPSMELGSPPAHCSYRRDALLEIGGFPEHLRSGEDTVVNAALMAAGYNAYRAADVPLIHHNRCATTIQLLRRYVVRGRGYGRMLVDRHRQQGRLARVYGPRTLFRIQVRQRVSRTDRQVELWAGEELGARYRRVRPLVRAGAIAHWLGTCFELVQPGRGRLEVLRGTPVVTILVLRSDSEGALVRTDLITRRCKVVELPAALLAGLDPIPEVPRPLALADALARALRIDVDDAILQPAAAPAELLPRLGHGFDARAAFRPGRRLALRRAAHAISPENVHAIDALEVPVDELAANVERWLDTRDFHERTRPLGASATRTAVAAEPTADNPVAGEELERKLAGRRLSGEEVAYLCRIAGWRGRDLVTAVAVARAESSWHDRAVNRTNEDWSLDRGLFQLNAGAWPAVTAEEAFDPVANAGYAFAIYENAGRCFDDWQSYVLDLHEVHLPTARAAVLRMRARKAGRPTGDAARHLRAAFAEARRVVDAQRPREETARG